MEVEGRTKVKEKRIQQRLHNVDGVVCREVVNSGLTLFDRLIFNGNTRFAILEHGFHFKIAVEQSTFGAIELGRLGTLAHFHPGTGGIEYVNRFIRKLPSADVAM